MSTYVVEYSVGNMTGRIEIDAADIQHAMDLVFVEELLEFNMEGIAPRIESIEGIAGIPKAQAIEGELRFRPDWDVEKI